MTAGGKELGRLGSVSFCRGPVPQTDPESSSDGIRSGSCKLKLEKFKWETNYRFLIGRAITFPRDVVDSPPFKSFNTGEESF